MGIGPLAPVTHRLMQNRLPNRMDTGIGAYHAKLLACCITPYSQHRYPCLQKALPPLSLVWVRRGEHTLSLAHRPTWMPDSIPRILYFGEQPHSLGALDTQFLAPVRLRGHG